VFTIHIYLREIAGNCSGRYFEVAIYFQSFFFFIYMTCTYTYKYIICNYNNIHRSLTIEDISILECIRYYNIVMQYNRNFNIIMIEFFKQYSCAYKEKILYIFGEKRISKTLQLCFLVSGKTDLQFCGWLGNEYLIY